MEIQSRAKSRRVPLEKRKRTECSCDRCKSRKQKCHRTPGQEKCRHCETHGYECTVTKSRKQRLYGSFDHFRSRLQILESLVKGLIPEADLSSIDKLRNTAASLGIPLPPDVALSDLDGNDGDAQQGDVPSNEHEEQLTWTITSYDKKSVHDLQGEGQYIGPASSYFFQMELRALLGRDLQGRKGRMYLFGANPTTDDSFPTIRATPFISPSSDGDSSACVVPSPITFEHRSPPSIWDSYSFLDPSVIDNIIRAYFEYVNVDFPVLQEALFLEKYDSWRASSEPIDKTWLCSFFCVLLLGRRVCSIEISREEEERWWKHVQTLLSRVQFTSSASSIKAMMLASLHLHNTGHRDACWTLTGAAIRIALAIGLHCDEIEPNGPRQGLELRKSLWWTLYEFEQLQVSSHDRPSAIEHALSSTRPPNERTLGLGASQGPPEHMTWWAKLSVLMGRSCRTMLTNQNPMKAFGGPLSPAFGLLRDLTRWCEALPQHLSLRVFETQPAAFQRFVLLLHIKYHYIVSLITRSAFLCYIGSLTNGSDSRRFLFTTSTSSTNNLPTPEIKKAADTCALSGRSACELLLKLDKLGKFNAVTWWDMYFLYCQSLVLALGIVCDVTQRIDCNASLELLQECSTTAKKHLSNPLIPETIHRMATVVMDLEAMAQDYFLQHQTADMDTSIEAITSNAVSSDINDHILPSTTNTYPPPLAPNVDEQRQNDCQLVTNSTMGQHDINTMTTLDSRKQELFPNNVASMSPYMTAFSPSDAVAESTAWRKNIGWDDIGSLLLGADELDITPF